MPRRCGKCCRGLPEWDTHLLCSHHRECTKLRPCAACKNWQDQTWAKSEAWLKAHPPVQRAPALVPSAASGPSTDVGLNDRDPPTDVLIPPAPPGENASPGSPGIAVDLHTSGGSDWESCDDPIPKRAWRQTESNGEALAGRQPAPIRG